MKELQERRKLRRFIYSKVTVFILLIAVLFMARAVWNVYQKNRVANFHFAQSQDRLEELYLQKNNIESTVNRLSSPRGIEGEIRRTMPVVKDGERVIMIIDRQAETTSLDSSEEEYGRGGWWAKLVNLFR